MGSEDSGAPFVTPARRGSRRSAPIEVRDLSVAAPDLTYQSIAFDPGGTTGWSVFCVHDVAMRSLDYKILDNITFWSAGEFVGDEDSLVDQMLGLAEAWPEAKVISEGFDLRTDNRSPDVLSPVRILAAFRYALGHPAPRTVPPRGVIVQLPALAKASVNDDRLTRWGFAERLRGLPHARDAVRHNITWLRRAKDILSAHASQ
jgi:hypothetical protein